MRAPAPETAARLVAHLDGRTDKCEVFGGKRGKHFLNKKKKKIKHFFFGFFLF